MKKWKKSIFALIYSHLKIILDDFVPAFGSSEWVRSHCKSNPDSAIIPGSATLFFSILICLEENVIEDGLSLFWIFKRNEELPLNTRVASTE